MRSNHQRSRCSEPKDRGSKVSVSKQGFGISSRSQRVETFRFETWGHRESLLGRVLQNLRSFDAKTSERNPWPENSWPKLVHVIGRMERKDFQFPGRCLSLDKEEDRIKRVRNQRCHRQKWFGKNSYSKFNPMWLIILFTELRHYKSNWFYVSW